MVDCPTPDAWLALGQDGAATSDAELEDHLDRCVECRELAAALARANVIGARSASDVIEPGLAPELVPVGARLGRFVVRGAVGAGGMGVVLVAHDPELDRNVALKVVRRLRDDVGWNRARERVLAEAQAMARLAHPNVVAIHDLFEIDGERLIAMEYVDGPDLEAWLATAPSPRDRLRVVIEVARGISAAHAAGVVHRDIKPSNILIGRDGRARVTDFGLAALGTAAGSGAVGTPGYVAPEIAAGQAADARSDQYSFALTAWRTLFDELPGARSGPIATVLRRALAIDPTKRHGSVRELVVALERAARPRGRVLFAAIGVFAIAAAIVAVFLSRGPAAAVCGPDPSALSTAWSPIQRIAWQNRIASTSSRGAASRLAETVDRAWQDWQDADVAVCKARARGVQSASATDCLDSSRRELTAIVQYAPTATPKQIEAALHSLPSAQVCLASSAVPSETSDLLTGVRHRMFKAPLAEVTAMKALGQYRAAVARLVEIERLVPANDVALRGDLLYYRADAIDRNGDPEAAVPLFEEAMVIAERTGNDVARVNTMVALLSVYAEVGKLDKAAALAPLAEAAIARVPRDRGREIHLEAAIASIAHDSGHYAEAEQHDRKIVAAEQELAVDHGGNTAPLAGALSNLGAALHTEGRVDDAIATEQRALAMFEATVGPDHPDTALPIAELATLRMEQGRNEDSAKLWRRAIAIWEAALGPDHPNLSEGVAGLARAENRLGHPEVALELYRRSARLARAISPEHPLVARAEYWIAALLDDQGKQAEALPVLEHSVLAWDRSGVEFPEAADARFLLAQYEWRAGHKARALTLANRANAYLSKLSPQYGNASKPVAAWLKTHR